MFADIASVFENGLANHKSALKRFSGNNLATSYSKFGELASRNLGVYSVKTRSFCRNLAAITTIFIRHVGVLKRIGR